MKNFLKSTVVFACVALMFCACSNDGTEVSGSLGSAEITSLIAGDGRALLEWTVPDDNVTASTISWSSDNGTKGSTNTPVKSSGVNTYQISNIPEGTYTIKVKNINPNDSSSEVSKTVTVYTSKTYEDSVPVIQSMSFSNSNTAEIVWLPYSDCTFVQLTYVDSNDEENTIVTEKHPADEPMTLTGVGAGNAFKLEAFYQPEGGEDEVSVIVNSVFDAAPPAPTKVVAAPGNRRIRVTWNMTSIDLRYVGATKVEYSGPSEGVFSCEDLVYGANECWVEGLTAGEYTLKIYNAKKGTETPSVVAERTVTVYETATYGQYYLDVNNITYYKESDVPVDPDAPVDPTEPTPTTGYVTDVPFIGVEIEWAKTHDDCMGVSVAYVPYGETEVVETDIFPCDVPTILPNAQRGIGTNSAFTYTSHFRPEGGADIVSLYAEKGADYHFDEVLPADLAAAIAYPGVKYSTVIDPVSGSEVAMADSYVVLSWTVAEERNLYSIIVSYTDNEEFGADTGEFEFKYPITTTTLHNLKAGHEYEFSFTPKRISGTKVKEPLKLSVTPYNKEMFAEAGMPSPEAYYTEVAGAAGAVDDEVKIYWKGDINPALKSVTVTYNGADATYEVINGTIPTTVYNVDLAAAGKTYQWSATYLPENALDQVVVKASYKDGVVVKEDYNITIFDVPNDITYNTTDGYYEIYTGWGLAVFADLVNGTNYASARAAAAKYDLNYTLASGHVLGTSYPSVNAKVMYDVDLSGFCFDNVEGAAVNNMNWSPIGLYSNKDNVVFYAGTFDGGNCRISNIYLSNNTSDLGAYVGLFGQTKGATVKNIVLHNPDVRCYNNSGGLIGKAWSSTISGCGTSIDAALHVEITGTVDAEGNASKVFEDAKNYRIRSLARGESISALIGQVDGCTITNCYNTVNVCSTGGPQGRSVGAIAGTTANKTTVTNCWNSGAVRARSYYAGGLVGNNQDGCTIENSYNTGFVSLGGTRGGGIVGTNGGNIYACYNTGDVYSTNSEVGGIAGYCSPTGAILASYNTATITSSGLGTAPDSERPVQVVIGGVVGTADGPVKGCYSMGSVASTATALDYVTLGAVAGGATSTANLEACYYTNEVSGLYGIGCIISSSTVSGDVMKVVLGSKITSASEGAAVSTIENLNSSALVAMNAMFTDINWMYVASLDPAVSGPTVIAKAIE